MDAPADLLAPAPRVPRSRRSAVAPWAAGGLVVALIAGVTVATRPGSGGGDGPAPLGIGTNGAVAADVRSSESSFVGGFAPLELATDLPGTPDDTAVHGLDGGRADSSAVATLAQGLGLTGEPVRGEGSWVVESEGLTLFVADGGGQPWSLSQSFCGSSYTGGDTAVSSDGTLVGTDLYYDGGYVSCGYAQALPSETGAEPVPGSAPSPVAVPEVPEGVTPPIVAVDPVEPADTSGTVPRPGASALLPPEGEPVRVTPSFEESVARGLARPVLDAVGFDAAEATLIPAGTSWVVQVDPEVAGLRTVGYATTVEVGLPYDATEGTAPAVLSASGYLAEPTAGDSYPLISAAEAFETIQAGQGGYALGAPEICITDPDGGCQEPVARRVVAAELGLSLTYAPDNRALLVPSWLFTVEGEDYPTTWPAVVPELLGDGTDGGSTGGPDVDPPVDGGPLPDDPGTGTEPGTPGTGYQPGLERVVLGADGATLSVTFSGAPEGDGDCESTYEITAESDAERVVLVVTGYASVASGKGEIACPAIAQVIERSLTLPEPLGDRLLVDGQGNKISYS